jgi:hypothetical protein
MDTAVETRSGRISAVAKEAKPKAALAVGRARRSRRHVTQGSTASEIRKALGISKKDLAAARRDLAALGFEPKRS